MSLKLSDRTKDGAGKTKRILVIEDNEHYGALMRRVLSMNHYEVVWSRSGRTGLKEALDRSPDLVLIDLLMPDLNGIQIYQQIRKDKNLRETPVIFITGILLEGDILKTAATAIGNNGFFQKSSNYAELLQMIHARLVSAAATVPPEPAQVLQRGAVQVDLASYIVTVQGKKIDRLGPKRFEILCQLLTHEDGMSREELLLRVWPLGGCLKTVDKTIQRLRRDLAVGGAADSIIAIPGGYKFIS